jgi:hypothetical protein
MGMGGIYLRRETLRDDSFPAIMLRPSSEIEGPIANPVPPNSKSQPGERSQFRFINSPLA